MDTTITRKRSRPSELGSDDEGASRKVQAVGTAPHNASTTKLPPHVTAEDDRHLTLASGITTEGEFQQVLSKAQKHRQRSALPPGLAGNNVPSPGTEPAIAPVARPTAPCSSPAPIAPPGVDPVATAGVPRTSVPTSLLTSRTVLFPDSPNCQLWQRERRLATIKASAPTNLSHREAQAVLRATPTSSVAAASGPPRVTPTGGKSYAAALGAPDKEAMTSTNHAQPRLQQHVQQAGSKKRGSIKLGPSPKEAPKPPALQAPSPEAAALSIPSSCHHANWVAAQIQALCSEPIRVYELKAALDQTRRRSAPGADRITFQMLRNLADAEKERLLECFNTIWDTGVLPESWLVALVTPILKYRKPAIALSSYRPVSLTSAACKAMERVTLARLEWIAAQLQYFPEQQSGFRCQRCTADCISDVVATLEDAKATGDVAMLVLLDVKSAFDGLPHAVIEACLDRLGLSGCLICFISAFLTGRTFRVRVGQELSEPRDIMIGVPQGSVLSPFLFNMALAGLPASLPAEPRFPVRCSIYADDVALWTRGPRKFMPSIRCSLQRALDAVTAFLGSIGLTVSTAKTEAMLIHPLASARRYTKQLKIAGRALPSQQMMPLGDCSPSPQIPVSLVPSSSASPGLHLDPTFVSVGPFFSNSGPFGDSPSVPGRVA
ncbi:hypothetical protein HPB49_021314 [Dermacentor silvarum]|uniref:Uncharacterized protein n=1 Tax=Dermacentor silvarum TaxID=543639 RepID=A0ACB8CZJ8_DERSI|nr:hypothetical protein HPB49_021314 [Dermacentor silvarum]